MRYYENICLSTEIIPVAQESWQTSKGPKIKVLTFLKKILIIWGQIVVSPVLPLLVFVLPQQSLCDSSAGVCGLAGTLRLLQLPASPDCLVLPTSPTCQSCLPVLPTSLACESCLPLLKATT